MAITPPGLEDPPKTSPDPNWREHARPLDIDGHDIYVFQEPQTYSTKSAKHYTPAEFGDVNPSPDGPDPDVWPLEGLDPGAPADVDRLVLTTNSFPVPHVAWVTPEYAEQLYGYLPYRVSLSAQDVPPWKRPPGPRSDDLLAAGLSVPSMDLTEQRKEALNRHARFWNGEELQGMHIIADKWPAFDAVFGDLDDGELRRLFFDDNTNPAIIESFRDHDWFSQDTSVFLRPQRVLRKKVWYCPTLAAKTLVNERDDLTSYRGDPKEGLFHRITVGLVALQLTFLGHEVSTYEPVGDYNVDVVARKNGNRTYVEVITGHQNWKLHRKTYRKLADLNSHGIVQAAFDTRDSAYTIMNHWMREGFCELPNGTFNSHPNLDQGRKQIREACDDPDVEWVLNDWITTDKLWRTTLGEEGPDLPRDYVTSLEW